MDVSFDLKLELAKNEYVKSINEINKKYELPLSIIEIILSEIYNEVSRMKIEQLQIEKAELDKLNESKKEGDK